MKVTYVSCFPSLYILLLRGKRSSDNLNPIVQKNFPPILLPVFRVEWFCLFVFFPPEMLHRIFTAIQTIFEQIQTPKTGKSRSEISQKLHNIPVMTPWKKYILCFGGSHFACFIILTWLILYYTPESYPAHRIHAWIHLLLRTEALALHK